MLDLLFIFTGIVFFVVAILYIYGCEWLIKDRTANTSQERIETSREREQIEGQAV